jgi:hypothetical protein
MELASAIHENGNLLLRYRRAEAPPSPIE